MRISCILASLTALIWSLQNPPLARDVLLDLNESRAGRNPAGMRSSYRDAGPGVVYPRPSLPRSLSASGQRTTGGVFGQGERQVPPVGREGAGE